ncbi:MAG TPA: malonate decarboxylase holo-[acyl-carrier-protein] synthase [Azospirillum sp.]|nr:malonate decarboxylase holo-[acyl-carrier-protein] synthase [Azospirillum sp.]
MPFESPARHDWVWLRTGWEQGLRSPLSLEDCETVGGWQGRGLPLVVARRQPGDGEDDLRLGLALPDKRRICVHVTASVMAGHTGPVPASVALPSAPEAWRPTLGAVIDASQALDVPVCVFGSLAWQHQSGLEYVRPNSDVDLLFAPRHWPSVEALLIELQTLAKTKAIPRLDGEVLLPDGGAVAWRELAAQSARLIVKGANNVTLRERAAIAALFLGSPFRERPV